MAWVATGLAVYSTIQGGKASDRQEALQSQSMAQSAAALEFDKEKYQEQLDRFNRVYGPVEDNLSEFYQQLSPKTLAAAGLQEQALEFEKAKANIKTVIAQRNIDRSGLEASILQQAELQSAETRAEIRAGAPIKVAQLQQDFLKGSPGLPDPTRVSEGMREQAKLTGDAADRAGADAASLYSSAGTLLSTGLENLARNRPKTPKANQGVTVDESGVPLPPPLPPPYEAKQ